MNLFFNPFKKKIDYEDSLVSNFGNVASMSIVRSTLFKSGWYTPEDSLSTQTTVRDCVSCEPISYSRQMSQFLNSYETFDQFLENLLVTTHINDIRGVIDYQNNENGLILRKLHDNAIKERTEFEEGLKRRSELEDLQFDKSDDDNG
ncbi:hypothetical protein A2397_01330 [Candidatus Amesbacteria bacterium RIFOXYB1_FULL_44_23]|uniref:Uncharacterized protein n=1 Tax=Candidatus Amesbacteria bacterium RIFOXYB1_FULL_44_23 TaxID=1797263 RepID=A0A1F4ZW04_9BACT|nr:MAG: hypothetical protein A2397_01330 [Candidatus Amesbacteria bacterium RIFOXYB1_FULL_44_23]